MSNNGSDPPSLHSSGLSRAVDIVIGFLLSAFYLPVLPAALLFGTPRNLFHPLEPSLIETPSTGTSLLSAVVWALAISKLAKLSGL